ncbi:hypothetical protein L208DRAFT_1104019, partial [Tricholoma matsutake]
SLHFVWYNRYSTHGHGVPTDIDIERLQREGKHKTNTSQFVPRASKEMKDNMKEYVLLSASLQHVLEWQKVKLESTLPEAYNTLKTYADSLPNEEQSPAYPFTGYVTNLNVVTLCHHDKGDKDWCLVIVTSDCEGGEIVFHELGLVVELRSGDCVIFKSAEISHLNLHYKGLRASLVLHSDRSFDSWVKDRNGWQ